VDVKSGVELAKKFTFKDKYISLYTKGSERDFKTEERAFYVKFQIIFSF